MRGSVESPFEAQLQETVAMELNTGGALVRFLPSVNEEVFLQTIRSSDQRLRRFLVGV